MAQGHELGSTRQARHLCAAPWYSDLARGFVPRLYLLDDQGWPMTSVDGASPLPTYEEALEASRLLTIATHEPTAG